MVTIKQTLTQARDKMQALAHAPKTHWHDSDKNTYRVICQKCGKSVYHSDNVNNVKTCDFVRSITTQEFIAAMRKFIMQKPGLDSADYIGYSSAYNSDRYYIQKYRTLALQELDKLEYNLNNYGADEHILMSYFLPHVGRLSLKLDDNNRYYVHYNVGQYFCTEYRNAAYHVLRAINSEYSLYE